MGAARVIAAALGAPEAAGRAGAERRRGAPPDFLRQHFGEPLLHAPARLAAQSIERRGQCRPGILRRHGAPRLGQAQHHRAFLSRPFAFLDQPLALERLYRLRDRALGGAEIARESTGRIGEAVGARQEAQGFPLGGVEAIGEFSAPHEP